MYKLFNIRIGGDRDYLGELTRFDDAKTFVAAYMEREASGDCAGVELHTSENEYLLYGADGEVTRWNVQENRQLA
jgi:hypothetical protein